MSQARLPVRGRSTTGAAGGWGGSGAASSAGSASSGCAGSAAALSGAGAGPGAATISGTLACVASTGPGCAAAGTGVAASGAVRDGSPSCGRTKKRASASAAVRSAPPNVTVPASPSRRACSGRGEPGVTDGWARPVDIEVWPKVRGDEQVFCYKAGAPETMRYVAHRTSGALARSRCPAVKLPSVRCRTVCPVPAGSYLPYPSAVQTVRPCAASCCRNGLGCGEAVDHVRQDDYAGDD